MSGRLPATSSPRIGQDGCRARMSGSRRARRQVDMELTPERSVLDRRRIEAGRLARPSHATDRPTIDG